MLIDSAEELWIPVCERSADLGIRFLQMMVAREGPYLCDIN